MAHSELEGLWRIMDQYPRLTPEEQVELVTSGRHSNARDLLFLHSVGLAVGMSRRYYIPNMSTYDIAMIAVEALQKVAREWDPAKGSFAGWAITGIQRAFSRYQADCNLKSTKNNWASYTILDAPVSSHKNDEDSDETLLNFLARNSPEFHKRTEFGYESMDSESKACFIEDAIWAMWESGWRHDSTPTEHEETMDKVIAHLMDSPNKPRGLPNNQDNYPKAKKCVTLYLQGYSIPEIANEVLGEKYVAKDRGRYSVFYRRVQNWIQSPIKYYVAHHSESDLKNLGVGFLARVHQSYSVADRKKIEAPTPVHSPYKTRDYTKFLEPASWAKRRKNKGTSNQHLRPLFGTFYSEFCHLREQGCNMLESLELCCPVDMQKSEDVHQNASLCVAPIEPSEIPLPIVATEHVPKYDHLKSIKEKLRARVQARNEPQSSPI